MGRFIQQARVVALASLSCFAVSGCGGPSNVAHVSGTVTLDGKPLSGAYIVFNPVAAGGQSSALTDDKGNYTLNYTREFQGAEIGEHTVRITTYFGGDPDADPPEPRVPERLPTKYNSESELKASVKSGSNELNFELESAGRIVQPRQE